MLIVPDLPAVDRSGSGRFLEEVSRGERFSFGRNWKRFLSVVDDERIAEAEKSLQAFLELDRLSGKSFLDAGSGSGLFSLAARRLGARVHSFDYDPDSLACTQELKNRYFPNDPEWRIEQGSLLDSEYLRPLGGYDVVYSWGVLHHTGAMWEAMEHTVSLVSPGGTLFISVYNDQGPRSRHWRSIKKLYCFSRLGRIAVSATFIPIFVVTGLLGDLTLLENPLRRYRDYKRDRGMSIVYDWFDWLGGYPFEVAKPEAVFDFCRRRGFILQRLVTCGGGLGCNQFVFRRE